MDTPLEQRNFSVEEILEKIKLLENRVSELETKILLQNSEINLETGHSVKKQREISLKEDDSILIDDATIEANVVEYGISWFGSIILIVGISFLISFLHNSLNGLVATLMGSVAILGVYFLSGYLKKSFAYLSFMLVISCHILLYFLVLKLFFFTNSPLIPFKGIVVILLLGISALNIYQAIKRKSEFMAIFGLLFVLITALLSDQTQLSLSIVTLSSIISFLLFSKQKWSSQLIFTLILVYLSFVIWLFGNPIMGHPFGIRTFHEYSLIYLFINGLIISSITLIPNKEAYKINIFTSGVVLNTIAFSFVLLAMVSAFFSTNYFILFLAIFGLCLTYSVFLKIRDDDMFIQSFYACCAFISLSVAVYGYSKFPEAYFWLSIQSLLVVSIALWYRSRLIVIMNTILFAAILIGYLTTTKSIDRINFTFAIVALVSARIINWKKTRLTLETEFIRNTYLFALFIMVLFGLYKAVPKEYVSISWTIAAASYFIFSVILKNTKYRYLSIFTLISAGFYMLIVDSSQITTGFRIITFLFIAAISLGIAFYYMNNIKKKQESEIDKKT